MPRSLARFTPLLALLALPALAAAGGEKVESPLYKNWSAFKKGTSVTYKSVTKTPKKEDESTITYKLIELTADKAVVEMQVTRKADGKETKGPAQKLENARYFTLPPGVKKADFGKPAGVTKQGEEELKIAGKKYKTKWYTAKTRVEAGDMITRTWSSSEVPGGLVKSVSKVAATKATTTMELVEVKKP
jgi:hypothetical protein